MTVITNLKWLIVVLIAGFTEIALRIELPKPLEDALWGLAILAISLLGIWAKSTISNLTARHDLEIQTIRDNQTQSRRERDWLLTTTQDQVIQIKNLQEANERLIDEGRQRDIETGVQKEKTERVEAENARLSGLVTDLKKRQDERHDAVNQAQAETAEAKEFARKETNRADAAEGDLAEQKRINDELRDELTRVKADNERLAKLVNPAPPTSGENPTIPPAETGA